jgi:hypothetical protein
MSVFQDKKTDLLEITKQRTVDADKEENKPHYAALWTMERSIAFIIHVSKLSITSTNI